MDKPYSFYLAYKTPLFMKGVMFMLFKTVQNMTEDEKKKFVNTMGITMLCLAEGKCSYQIAKELKLETYAVDYNIDEMLYTLRKSLGWKRYVKALFVK